jgi:hypothetical protein
MTPKVLWEIVKKAAQAAGIEKLAPHDLRRTCARLCHLAGGELDQIQFLLGHVSIQTTEHYLGCKQKLRIAVNDKLGIKPWCQGTITRPFLTWTKPLARRTAFGRALTWDTIVSMLFWFALSP